MPFDDCQKAEGHVVASFLLDPGCGRVPEEGFGAMARDNAEVRRPAGPGIRQEDIEPYTALRWVGSMFKAAAVFLAVALFTEFMVGLQVDGTAALPELLGELVRTVVVAVVLWGAGDLVRLLIHVGHDLRAQRVLLGRLVHRVPAAPAREWQPGSGGSSRTSRLFARGSMRRSDEQSGDGSELSPPEEGAPPGADAGRPGPGQ